MRVTQTVLCDTVRGICHTNRRGSGRNALGFCLEIERQHDRLSATATAECVILAARNHGHRVSVRRVPFIRQPRRLCVMYVTQTVLCDTKSQI